MSTLSSGNDSSLWVDYLEGELDLRVKEDLELLLTHSETDQEIVKGLHKTRTLLMQSSEVDLPQDENYYRDLQERIARGITAAEDLKTAKSKFKALKRKFQGYFSFSGPG